jgi:hypothetical protein
MEMVHAGFEVRNHFSPIKVTEQVGGQSYSNPLLLFKNRPTTPLV